VKKNLSNIHLNSSSVDDQSLGSQVQETCEPCSLECEKMNVKINNRKLSNISEEELIKLLTPFKY
tara:strand:- start:261 stop:455 length:195 start_codon:yes stop_codon:yes gene_type:complete